MIRQATVVVIVAMSIVAVTALGGVVGTQWLTDPWLVGLGLMILLAYAAGELLRGAGLPALLGWIGVGIVLGPSFSGLMPQGYPLAIVGEEVSERLGLVQVLIVGVIGMVAGAKLKISELAGNARLPLTLVAAFLVIVVPFTMAGVLVAGQLFPVNLEFMTQRPASEQGTMALLFGVLSFGLAPTVTVAMLQDLRSRGPLSTVVLGTVIVAEVVLFVLFALVLSMARSVVGADADEALIGVVAEVGLGLGLSVGLGLLVGAVVWLYFRFVRRERLIFALVVLVAGYLGVDALGAEPLLTFLVAGFAVQAFTEEGDRLLTELERIALPVFVVYFAVVAAGIDLEGTLTYLPLVVILVLTRCVGLYWGAQLASQKAVRNNHVYEYLQTAFFSQAAVVLVLATVVAHPEQPFVWGVEFQSVVVATVVAYLVLGPVTLKLGLDRSGETRRARRALFGDGTEALEVTESEEKWLDRMSGPVDLEKELVEPDLEDGWLRGHVADLREELVAQGHDVYCDSVREQSESLGYGLEEVGRVVEGQREGLRRLVEAVGEGAQSDELVAMARKLQEEYARQMAPVVKSIEETSGVALPSQSAHQFFDRLRSLDDMTSVYRIEREKSLDEPKEDDSLWMWGLKSAQRLRGRVGKDRYRTVPVGRLWRYHVELALPVRLAARLPEAVVYYERFWQQLWRHLRGVDRFWEELIAGITRPDEEIESEAAEVREEGEDPHFVRAQQKGRHIDRFFEDFLRRHRELEEMAEKGARLIEYRFAEAITKCYERFLEATKRAGTIYLPRFRYRAAGRFNQGRRAELRMVDRLQRQEEVVAGYRGWIRLDYEVASFVQWTRLFRDGVDQVLKDALGVSWRRELAELEEVCSRALEEVDENGRDIEGRRKLYYEKLRPKIAEFRHSQKELVARLTSGEVTRELQEMMDRRLSQLPEVVVVLSGTPEEIGLASEVEHRELPLRRWMETKVGREMRMRLVEFNERAAQRIERRLSLISGVEQALEFNLVTALEEASELREEEDRYEMARQGLERASELIEGFLEGAKGERQELRRWLDRELDGLVAQAVEPVEQRKPRVLQRRLAMGERSGLTLRGESWLGLRAWPVLEKMGWKLDRVDTALRTVGSKAVDLLLEEAGDVDRVDVRRTLVEAESQAPASVPAIYRRLFAPVPLDMPEFYRSRRRAEDRLLETVQAFFKGQSQAVLVDGEPGIGKRSFVRHLVPGRVFAVEESLGQEQFATVKVGRNERGEKALCRAIGEALFSRGREENFEKLTRRIERRMDKRKILVLEQAERAVLRTPEGLKTARRFFSMIEETSNQVLWVVTMGSAASRYLRAHLDLDSYFSHRETLKGLDRAGVEALIMSRHRVSEFELEFRADSEGGSRRWRKALVGGQGPQAAGRQYFDWLAQRSGGNPRVVLQAWLRSVEPNPVVDSALLARSEQQPTLDLLGPLEDIERLLLAMLSLHYSLSPKDAAQILRVSDQEVRRRLRSLERLGFVENSKDRPEEYRILASASVMVYRELCRRGMI